MSAKIIDGNRLASQIRAELKQRSEALADRDRQPTLVVILVGDDPASQVYVRNKIRACSEVGIESREIILPANTGTEHLLQRIHQLAEDDDVDGILLQLPVPEGIDEARLLAAIPSHKDVDGFHALNVGALAQGNPQFIPCTPYGVMKMLQHTGVNLQGMEAVVIGRSNIVGKPMAQLLTAAGATVTVCHSKTRDLAFHTRRADLLVAAIGRPRMISGDMIKPGAILIDVGINRDESGKLCGDLDYDSCRQIAGWITPVPGGVGPMTITMLLTNTLEAVERNQQVE
jgi:methylenetetrahydrofolate dehydrogenase (NADP+) / methenyltetrahydrofolate cyclohydrolase